MNRRTSALCSLLLTAALLCALPALWESLASQSGQRMAERLQPKKAQLLTVWLLSDQTEGQKQLLEQIAAFERGNAGARVYLRRADAAELFAADAVPPDVLLFSPGALTDPGRVLRPLAGLQGDQPSGGNAAADSALSLNGDALQAGRSAGWLYAVPLWYAPSVLAVPAAFFPEPVGPTPAPAPSSFFALATPVPATPAPGEAEALPGEALIPWQAFLVPGALAAPEGIALVQLLSMCPSAMRPALIAALTDGDAAQALAPRKTAPPAQARVMTLAAFGAAARAGEALTGFALTPAATERVLLMGLCGESALAKAFLAHMLSDGAQAGAAGHGLLPVTGVSLTGDAMTLSLSEMYRRGLLFPNAFEHTGQELAALCGDAFLRNLNPAETLLRLR